MLDYSSETIVAIATSSAHNEGATSAIGIIRISGEQVLSILERNCKLKTTSKKTFQSNPRQMLLCDFIERNTTVSGITCHRLDTGLAVYYRKPYSYTGEELVELFLHGNPLILRKMLASILDNDGTRLARAGEFTKRAYLNGKLDLSQAEAVNSIIRAKSDWELMASQRNFEGELKRLSAKLRSDILYLKAEIEAGIDFDLDDDAELSYVYKIRDEKISELQNTIAKVLDKAKQSEYLRSDFQVAIVGLANAGKSSLFNCLLGLDRSIVSSEAGTTRDYLSEKIQLFGRTIRLLDTAGLRFLDNTSHLSNSINSIEKEGIRLAKKVAQKSQLILHVYDGARDAYQMDLALETNIPHLEIVNKSDLPSAKLHLKHLKKPISVSCKTKQGLKIIEKEIAAISSANSDFENAILLEERHRNHLRRAQEKLKQIFTLNKARAPDEIIALDLDECLQEIGALSVPIDNEEVLGRIFSMFCIGK